MASVGSGDKTFGHLSQELQLMVTDYLPYEDKIKLVDIFPPVINQIDTFDTSKIAELYDDKVLRVTDCVKLFNKLTKVKRVLFTSHIGRTINKRLLEAISKGTNKDIRDFILMEALDFDDGMCFDECVLAYIRNVLKSNPNYDTSGLNYVFRLFDDDGGDQDCVVVKLINENPDLKLKLHLFTDCYDPMFLADGRIRKMITVLEVSEQNGDNDLLQEFILPSVGHLIYKFDLKYEEIDSLTDQLEKILKQVPNITKLTLSLAYERMSDFEQFTHCLLSLTNLEELELNQRRTLTDRELQILVPLLLAPREDDLVKLTVAFSMDIGSVFNMNIKPGFKLLRFQDSGFELIVKKNHILIKHMRLSLIDTFNKFPSVKYVDVVTKNKKYIKQLKRDIRLIRKGLPRNRSLTLTVLDD